MKKRLDERKLISKSGLLRSELLSMRWRYVSIKKEMYGKAAKLKDCEPFSEYILFISKDAWCGILLITSIAFAFSLCDFYKNHSVIRSFLFIIISVLLLVSCVIKANGDVLGVGVKTMLKLLFLRLLIVFRPFL